MDIGTLKQVVEEMLDVNFVAADDDGNGGVGFKVLGINSETYQTAAREWQTANVRRNAKRGVAVKAATQEGAAMLVDMVKQREQKICEACVKEIYGIEDNGAAVAPTPDVLTRIFEACPTWRTKTVATIEGETGFTKA